MSRRWRSSRWLPRKDEEVADLVDANRVVGGERLEKLRHLLRADELHGARRAPRTPAGAARVAPPSCGETEPRTAEIGTILKMPVLLHHRRVVLAQQHLQRRQQRRAGDRLDRAERDGARDARMHRVRLAQVVAEDDLRRLAHVQRLEIEARLFRGPAGCGRPASCSRRRRCPGRRAASPRQPPIRERARNLRRQWPESPGFAPSAAGGCVPGMSEHDAAVSASNMAATRTWVRRGWSRNHRNGAGWRKEADILAHSLRRLRAAARRRALDVADSSRCNAVAAAPSTGAGARRAGGRADWHSGRLAGLHGSRGGHRPGDRCRLLRANGNRGLAEGPNGPC